MSLFGTTPRREPIATSVVAPGWRPAVVSIGIAVLVFGAVFRHEVAGAVRVWIESTAYNHCFLILPLVGFLLWERRAVIAAVSPSPSAWPLLLMPVLSGLWLAATILDVQEGRQLLVVAMFEITLLATLGLRVFRLLLAPLLFLFFLVPSGAFLVPTLQKITADVSVAGLHALHIPVFSDGFMIEIPEGTFEIAEACAGLRFLIASAVFGCFFAVTMYESFLRRAIFFGLSVIVPIAANGMRALGIIVLAHLKGSAAAVEADHILYGWLFFTFVIIALVAVGMTFAQKIDRQAPAAVAGPSRPSPWGFAIVIPAAMVLALAGPAYAARLAVRDPVSPFPPSQGLVSAPWQRVSDAAADWRPIVSGANRESLEAFQEPGSGVVIRYIALYRLRADGDSLTTTGNRVVDNPRWRVVEYGHAEANLGGKKIAVASTEIVSGQRRRLVWSFYIVDGRVVAGLMEAKLLRAHAVLLDRAPVGAFVAISADMDDPNDLASDQLKSFLAASPPLLQFVDALAR